MDIYDALIAKAISGSDGGGGAAGGADLVIICDDAPVNSGTVDKYTFLKGSLQDVEQKMADGKPVTVSLQFLWEYYPNQFVQCIYDCNVIDFAYSYIEFTNPSYGDNACRRLTISFDQDTYELSTIQFSEL